jgi:hypothetical protein
MPFFIKQIYRTRNPLFNQCSFFVLKIISCRIHSNTSIQPRPFGLYRGGTNGAGKMETTGARQRRRGFNLIEAAIVLGLVGLVVGGIWVAASAVYENYKVNKTVEGVSTIARNVQNLISERDALAMWSWFMLNDTLLAANAIPQDWVHGTQIIHPYGSNLKIFIDHDWGTRFDFELANIPQSACVNIVIRMGSIAGAARSIEYSGLTNGIGLGEISVNYPHFITFSFPVSMDDAKTACNQEFNLVFMTFGYTRIN